MLFIYGVFVEAAVSEGRKRARMREHHLDARRNPWMDVIVMNEVQSARTIIINLIVDLIIIICYESLGCSSIGSDGER